MPNDLQSAPSPKRAPDTDGGSAAADFGLGLPPQETERRDQNASNGKDGQPPQDNPQSEPGDEDLPIPTTYPTA
ncbi:MAG TPA: hypothetical protein VGU61_02060 [Noviherbaspirillum sp.]|uniref:hypothetical protein n=1 Tax=Noviherbaspirillum sp. TaxID=1926288 RepID=UPI002DDD3120|nr:hypothetical protein [Noviherbaspirillum sp.]HEV2609025.1 hypothetical protein [Noviherbaspirillum sp.]